MGQPEDEADQHSRNPTGTVMAAATQPLPRTAAQSPCALDAEHHAVACAEI